MSTYEQFIEEIAEAARINSPRFFVAHRVLPRGIGTTWKQVAATPAGSIYVVHNSAMRHEVERNLMRQGRAPRELDIRIVERYAHADSLQGLSVPVTVDHAVWHLLDDEVAGYLLRAADHANERHARKQQAVAA